MKHFTETTSAKTPEKQVIKEIAKEISKLEKHEKLEKNEKAEKDKLEKEKPEKEAKEHKEQKEAKERKEHKEKLEKEAKEHKHEHKESKEKDFAKIEQLEKVQKDVETLPMQDPAFAQAQSEPADLQANKSAGLEKIVEKLHEKPVFYEKYYYKEYKYEKFEHKEWDKIFDIGNIPDPGPVETFTETRLASLEAAVAQLVHFIPENLRPDLSKGALKSEKVEETAPETPAENPEEGKKS